MSYRLKSFDGGSDHILFIDSYFGIPSLMFGHEDLHYHSSMDTVEYCDSTELKRVIAMALSISYTLSIFDIDLTKKFWPIVHQCLFIRIGNSIKLLDELSLSFSSSEKKIKTEEGKALFFFGQDILDACFQYELESLEWLNLIVNSSDVLLLIESTKVEIKGLLEHQRLKWNEQCTFDNEEMDILKSKFSVSYELNFDGPFLTDNLFKLIKVPIFKSLEYLTIVKPYKIMELVNHLEREQLIKKKNS